MLSGIGWLLLIAYLPGAVIFRMPMADRAKRAALPAEERLFWVVVISVVVSTTLAFALAAMSVYSLGVLGLCNASLAGALLLASRGNLRLAPNAPRPSWTALFPAALIALGAWMYFAVPAAEHVLGGRDPGVYMSEGIQIAQRRSLVTTDRVAAAIPPAMRDLFFPSGEDPSYYSVRFMGFHLRNADTGTVTGQFPQGYPIWIAIAYGLDGVTGTRRVIAWWAILGVLAVYFAAARLLGPLPAAAASGLLTVHVIQTWYARYPNSEIVTQALLFAALLAHARAHEDEDRFFGPIAASLLGLALFTRFPVVLAVGAAVVASLLAHVDGHRTRAGFLATLAVWMGAAGLYYTTQLRPYFGRPVAYLYSLEPIHLVPLAAGGAVLCFLLWAIRTPRIAAIARNWLPATLIAAVTIGGLYALFVREPGGRLAPHDAHSVRIFASLYLTRIAFLLALAGYALVVWRSFWRAPAMILAVTTLAFFFLYKMRIWPEHFWLARRFIPAILPGALMFVAAALFAPLWLLPRRRLWSGRRVVGLASMAAGVLGVFLLGQQYLSASQNVRTHIEYAGVIPQIERLAARFGEDDLVLVEARAASDLHTLALPLSYIWARNVLVLYSPRPDKTTFVEFLAWARKKYQNVYFIGGGGTDLLSRGVRAEPVETEIFAVPEFESTPYDVYPKMVRMKPFDLTVYRFVDGSHDEGAFRLDVGGADDLHLIRFHGKERSNEQKLTFRWTRDRSFFSVPEVRRADRALILRMSNGGRPRGVAPANVSVFLGDRAIGTADPAVQFSDYTFAIPAELATQLAASGSATEVRLESTTWIPRDVMGGADDRQLGVMIDRAEIRVMFQHLQIPYRGERWLVGLADAGLRALTFPGSPLRAGSRSGRTLPATPPKRILLLRLERVGDLLMVLDAIARVRALAPHAEIDLVVGSWNLPLARLIPAVNSIETLDVPWMARDGRGLPWGALLSRAKVWRGKAYDLGINFEPDIRSNLLLARSGALRRVGFASGGGGAVLSEAVESDPAAHIAANAMTLVARAFEPAGRTPRATHADEALSVGQGFSPVLIIPDEARRRAEELIGRISPGGKTIGIQPAAGRQIKEWDPVRFAEIGSALARTRGAKVVLVGSASDRAALDAVRAAWPSDVARIDLPEETDLTILAAVLERLALFITGDTGPMHLAAAVGTPVLAIFGPSLPTRYAPLSPKSRIVRIDIPCSPCNLMRKPPQRCVGHVPDCLAGIESVQVLKAANEMLDG